MAIKIPIHSRSTFNATKMGATTGTMMNVISIKSMKKPAMKKVQMVADVEADSEELEVRMEKFEGARKAAAEQYSQVGIGGFDLR